MHTMLSSVTDNIMQEIKFNIYGEMFHANGYSRNEILSYIAATKEEALATCKRLYPKSVSYTHLTLPTILRV